MPTDGLRTGAGRAKIGKETLGRLFIDMQGVIWEQVGYTDRPTASFRRAVDPSQRLTAVIGSSVALELEQLSAKEEASFRKDEARRVAQADADYVLQWLRQTEAPENIVGLQERVLGSIG